MGSLKYPLIAQAVADELEKKSVYTRPWKACLALNFWAHWIHHFSNLPDVFNHTWKLFGETDLKLTALSGWGGWVTEKARRGLWGFGFVWFVFCLIFFILTFWLEFLKMRKPASFKNKNTGGNVSNSWFRESQGQHYRKSLPSRLTKYSSVFLWHCRSQAYRYV